MLRQKIDKDEVIGLYELTQNDEFLILRQSILMGLEYSKKISMIYELILYSNYKSSVSIKEENTSLIKKSVEKRVVVNGSQLTFKILKKCVKFILSDKKIPEHDRFYSSYCLVVRFLFEFFIKEPYINLAKPYKFEKLKELLS